jgi:hypothetical protein
MGFSHTSPTATQVLQHKCDQWASADAGIVRQDSPRASRPQAILKFRPPSSLDYKARHGPQTNTLINKSSLHVFLKVFKTYWGIMTSKNFAGFYTISKDFLY